MAQPVVIKPTAAHSATVVFLHGLGDTGNGWSPVFESARAPHVKYICPSAGSRPVTINMGMSMPAWFDIKGLSMDSEEDEAGIKQSAKQIHSILDAEVAAGIPSERIILGGFSMGGALAIYTALTYPKRLAGVVALSSFIIMRNHLPGTVSANHQVPIFQGHGDVDPLVALPFARATHELLKAFNPNATFKLYSGMGHSASDKELKDVQAFLEKNIKAA
jgi:lysophospholipase-2